MQNKNRISRQDIKFMKKALAAAASVTGKTSPDPAVGAVVVKNGRLISRGFHDRFKTPHAETYALKKAGKRAKGATLYINLEPCCHFGNTPPCTDNIIKSGIKRVVAAMQDPNPLVNGKGFKKLEKAGIEVVTGVLEKEALKLNETFVKHISTGRPFVTLKTAMSLDGKTATSSGESKWITGTVSRKYAHRLRALNDAVLAGINTVIKDDPLLTARLSRAEKQPLRVIVDSRASIPLDSKVVKDKTSFTLIAVTKEASLKKVLALKQAGCSVLEIDSKEGRVDLKKLFAKLGKMCIASILIEGGSEIAGSVVENGLADKVIFFVSQKIIGGKHALPAVGGKGFAKLNKAAALTDLSVKRSGEDLIIEGYIKNRRSFS
ncbi:MAG: bifunctional diaminohydroxyphosphoribosylaminopyrimidine deaminase/5-amino-6-(5-phosphoribosylamino)uracil reductase RibD [Candidatus Margulisiibacteriota bacterium]